jgi:hypothetical protein
MCAHSSKSTGLARCRLAESHVQKDSVAPKTAVPGPASSRGRGGMRNLNDRVLFRMGPTFPFLLAQQPAR